ncbi:MAG TPA: hypothetical protein VFN61_11400, partial [Acidimicrobiales bacterium]|nr:hypothetical protein [Acidimicrobiales bacterium]
MSSAPVPTGNAFGRPALTWRAPVLAVVVGAVLAAWPYSEAIAVAAFGGLALALVVVDYLLAPRPGRFGIERVMSPVVELDHELEISWRVTNPGGRTVRVAFSDELAPSLRPAARGAAVEVGPKGAVTATATLLPSRRGRFAPSRLVVRVEGPMRLAARQSRRELPGLLKVYP